MNNLDMASISFSIFSVLISVSILKFSLAVTVGFQPLEYGQVTCYRLKRICLQNVFSDGYKLEQVEDFKEIFEATQWIWHLVNEVLFYLVGRIASLEEPIFSTGFVPDGFEEF